MSRLAKALLLGGLLAGFAAALPVNEASAQTGSATDWRPSRSQVNQLQLRLKELGFDPGQADGQIGRRTTAAVRAYQTSIGVDADGIVTPALYERLMTPDLAPESSPGSSYVMAGPSAPAIGAAPVAPSECTVGPREYWRFQDSRGSSFELILRADGSVEGSNYPGHWRWQPKDGGVEIVYDNGMGQRVTRIGHLQDENRMTGEATDARGQNWNWNAERLVLPAADDANCPADASAP